MHKICPGDIVLYQGRKNYVYARTDNGIKILPAVRIVKEQEITLIYKKHHKVRFYGVMYRIVSFKHKKTSDGTVVVTVKLKNEYGMRNVPLEHKEFGIRGLTTDIRYDKVSQ